MNDLVELPEKLVVIQFSDGSYLGRAPGMTVDDIKDARVFAHDRAAMIFYRKCGYTTLATVETYA